jgi:hypothetical protein
MPKCLVAALVGLLALSVPATSQSPGSIGIEADLRLFTMMAALNVAGFDIELGSQYHPVRAAARDLGKALDSELVERLRTYYRVHKGNETDDAQLPKYISLAVNLTDPPDLKLTFREELLPPDARSVKDFADLLREFYQRAKLTQVWTELRPQYEAEMNRLGPAIREQIVRSDAYLRVPFGRTGQRTLLIYVELAAPINSVNLRTYQDSYFVVLGYSANPRLDEIRHAHLHFQLDGIVAREVTKVNNAGALTDLIAKAEGVQPDYAGNFFILMTESLIRAMELRLDRVPPDQAKDTIDGYYRTGLLLTPYFYKALEAYEMQESGIREAFADMAKNISVKTEQQRFQSTFFSIPVAQKTAARPEVPEPAPVAVADPVRDLLKEGEAALNSNNDEKAEAAFTKVLESYNSTNGPALYGLALIASKRGDSDTAKDYFDRTTRTDVDPSMKVWAHIFLGRIFDLHCERQQALESYQQAIAVGDNTRNAQAAAREGVSKPYGDGCR